MPFLRTFAETCKQNRMKPALTYYALLVLLLAFCFSCKTDSEKKKYVIGVSQCTLEGSWRKSMLLDMKVQASEYPVTAGSNSAMMPPGRIFPSATFCRWSRYAA